VRGVDGTQKSAARVAAGSFLSPRRHMGSRFCGPCLPLRADRAGRSRRGYASPIDPREFSASLGGTDLSRPGLDQRRSRLYSRANNGASRESAQWPVVDDFRRALLFGRSPPLAFSFSRSAHGHRPTTRSGEGRSWAVTRITPPRFCGASLCVHMHSAHGAQ